MKSIEKSIEISMDFQIENFKKFPVNQLNGSQFVV